MYSLVCVRTTSVLSSLGLHSDRPRVHTEASPEKYEYLQALGSGGMAEVVRAWDRDLHRFVAIKRMRPELDSKDDVLRFVKEAQVTGKLEHPGIVPVHDLGIDSQGRLCFSLKLIEGESLKSIIAKRKSVQEISVGVRYKDVYTTLRMIEIFISVCQAVAYAHSKGVIHRDLKPDNIMLGRYGEALVVDWGIAKVLADNVPDDQATVPLSSVDDLAPEKSVEGRISWTPAYMPPEQTQRLVNSIDERSDVYALGAMLYTIIAGRPPYEGGSAFEVLKKVQQGPPRPLSSGTVGFHPVPRELKAICNKAMAREPENRYASAEELRDDVLAYLEDMPVQASSPGLWERSRKWLKRNRKQSQTVFVTAFTAIVLVSGAYYGYREWRVRGLLGNAQQKLSVFQRGHPATGPRDADPAQAYEALNAVFLDLQRALDLAPGRGATKALLSDTYMAQRRLATSKESFALADNARREVVRYEGGEPNRYSPELNGSAVVDLKPDPPESQIYVFKFVPVETQSKTGDPESRLVPVPYNLKSADMLAARFQCQQSRARSGPAVLPNAHSIFNLEPMEEALVSPTELHNLALPPGSYLVVARNPNRLDTRVPLLVPRFGRVEQTIHLPSANELPAGFFYVAGGTARLGGSSANALPEQSVTIHPFLLYHDEINMGDYSEFLKALVATGKRLEPESRVPIHFGNKIPVLPQDAP